jgi:MFS family permease
MESHRKHRWGILGMFMLAHAVNDGFEWVIPPLLPVIREHFHLSYTEMGAFFTLFRGAGSLLQAPASYLAHVAPASAVLVGGLLWSSTGMLLASFSVSYGMLVWISAIGGIGRSTYHPLAISLLSRIFDRDFLGRAIGFHLSSSAAGHVVAPFLVVFLLDAYGWRIPLLIWSCLGLVAGVSLFVFLRHRRIDFPVTGKRWSWPFFSRSLAIYLLAMTTWGIVQSGMTAFLPVFLVDQRGFSVEKAAAVFGLISVAAIVSRPILGAVMDWTGRRKPVINAGFLLSGLAIYGLAAAESPWVTYPSFMLLGIFLSGHSGLADTYMVEMVPPHRREETLGFAFSLRMGTASFSPFFVGLLSEGMGVRQVFLILGTVSILSTLILAFAEETVPADPPHPPGAR